MSIVSPSARNDNPSQRLRVAQQLLRLIRGREDYVGVSMDRGFRPEALATPLTPERLAAEHLGGRRCLGCYLMRLDNRVWCSCVDFDNKVHRPDAGWKEKAEAVYRDLADRRLSPLVEISQSGTAAHVWLFFREPILARIVRAFWLGVLSRRGIAVPEIYPRQDELSGKGLGNLIRYPLWSLSRLVDVTDGWKPLAPIRAMSAVAPISLADLERAAAEMGVSLNPPPQPPARARQRKQVPRPRVSVTTAYQPTGELPDRVKLLLERDDQLAARWEGDTEGLTDTSQSSVVMSIACLLVRRYVPTGEIEAAIRHWCEQHLYEKGDRDDWIEGVLARAYDLIGASSLARGCRIGPHLPEDTPDLIRGAFRQAVKEIVTTKRNLKTRRTSR